MKLAAALALAAALFSAPATAVPDERPRRVALFPVEGDAELDSRLTAELLSRGFQLESAGTATSERGTFDDLRSAMRASGADLALRIVVEPALIRLWIVNAATGKELYREVA